MATAPRKSISEKGAAAPPPTAVQAAGKTAAITADKVASKAAAAAKEALSKAGKAASGAARQAQVAAQAAAQGAGQMTKAAAAKAAVPVARLAQKLGGAAEAAPKTLKSVDAAEKGVAPPVKPLEESELAFEEEEKEGPNRTLICTSFLVYVLFVATCVVFAEYSFQNYDLDPTDIRTHAPPLGTEKDNTTTRDMHRRLPLKRGRNDSNITLVDQAPVETEPEFDWDALRLDDMLSAEYVPEVLSNQLLRARSNGTTPGPVQHAPGVWKQDDYIPEILGDQ